ncbi:hypothetical protein GH714_033669 [Hevea brasiliensis]|uniref:NB-ARC domain-containing protein n=1 Tax=Hevea brasiliensis TaxID=3981 RepID=A0A6A6NCC5_HEVBR|nr:hypothetical protein GH714_033669 [Hevea brasiliensis]
MEEIGEVSFRALVSRSLFQRSSGNKLSYVMHDLVHDLAKFVSGEFCFWLEANNSHNITGKTRHLGYLQSQDAFQKLEGIYEAKSLRTFLPLNLNLSRRSALFFSLLSKKVLHKLLPMLTCLRVLSLSRYCYITELPDSIGNLKYLRLLDLSFTGIKWLPNSTCKLYNLQRLALTDRKDLIELPANMHNLRNLSHLDLAGTNIKEIPVHVSKLKQCERSEDALEARLKEKNQLEGLWLEWSINSGDSRKEREVLEKLQPHTNLKELTIKNYGGTAFPFWLVERSSLSNIVCLCLSNCKYCISLPPLGQLHSLKDLSITGFYAVETIGPEFYGSDGLATKPFESLQTLRFKEMVEWEEWFPFENDIEGRAFPCLQELYVENCPKLTKHLPQPSFL